MKTAISIPDEIFAAAERLARRLALNRSELYSKAVARFVEEHDTERVTQALDDVYATESSELDREVKSLQDASLPSDGW